MMLKADRSPNERPIIPAIHRALLTYHLPILQIAQFSTHFQNMIATQKYVAQISGDGMRELGVIYSRCSVARAVDNFEDPQYPHFQRKT